MFSFRIANAKEKDKLFPYSQSIRTIKLCAHIEFQKQKKITFKHLTANHWFFNKQLSKRWKLLQNKHLQICNINRKEKELKILWSKLWRYHSITLHTTNEDSFSHKNCRNSLLQSRASDVQIFLIVTNRNFYKQEQDTFSHHFVTIIPNFVSKYKQTQFQTTYQNLKLSKTKLKRDLETNPNSLKHHLWIHCYGFFAYWSKIRHA